MTSPRRPSRPLGQFVSGPETASGSGASTRPYPARAIKARGLVCSGDDSCQVPSHWQDAEYSGPHRDPAAVAAMALNEPCCEHCACGTPQGWPERLGHDDTCRYGCNDVPLQNDPERQFGDTTTSANGGAE